MNEETPKKEMKMNHKKQHSPVSAKNLNRDELIALAFQLKKEGKSFREIAKRVGVKSTQTIHTWLHKYKEKYIQEQIYPVIEEMRQAEQYELLRYRKQVKNRIKNETIKPADAYRLLLEIHKSICKLNGLPREPLPPTQIESEYILLTEDGQPIYNPLEITDYEIVDEEEEENTPCNTGGTE